MSRALMPKPFEVEIRFEEIFNGPNADLCDESRVVVKVNGREIYSEPMNYYDYDHNPEKIRAIEERCVQAVLRKC